MNQIWVDFNDRDIDGTVPAMQRDASGVLSMGDSVVAVDEDGNTCRAVIADQDGEVLSLAMEWGTFARSTVEGLCHR